MERIERLGEVKYHMNRLSVDELNVMRAHTIARVSQALHEVEIIEEELATRRPEQQLVLDHTWDIGRSVIERTDVAQLSETMR